MAWEAIPFTVFGRALQAKIRSAWVFLLCTAAAFAGSQFARAQDAASPSLLEPSVTVKATPTYRPTKRTSEPSVEISTETPSEKPAAVAEETRPAEELARAVAVRTPMPQYPYEAKRAHITGSGVCVMTVNAAAGNVTGTVMEQSTGNGILDKATTEAFQKWRFKPGMVSQVRVPISYE
jgi:TonB family protein